jgi:hypothetical protein
MAKLTKEVVTYFHFYCPGCKHQHTYSIKDNGEGWSFNGNIDSPSFTPSLLNRSFTKNPDTGSYDVEKDRCHLFITNGKIVYCGDCHHEYAGKIVELPEI